MITLNPKFNARLVTESIQNHKQVLYWMTDVPERCFTLTKQLKSPLTTCFGKWHKSKRSHQLKYTWFFYYKNHDFTVTTSTRGTQYESNTQDPNLIIDFLQEFLSVINHVQ